MTKREPKIGDRVYWQSLDPSIPRDNGTITELSGANFTVKWDDPGEFGEPETIERADDLHRGASCLRLA